MAPTLPDGSWRLKCCLSVRHHEDIDLKASRVKDAHLTILPALCCCPLQAPHLLRSSRLEKHEGTRTGAVLAPLVLCVYASGVGGRVEADIVQLDSKCLIFYQYNLPGTNSH